jgi:hypothetical protein
LNIRKLRTLKVLKHWTLFDVIPVKTNEVLESNLFHQISERCDPDRLIDVDGAFDDEAEDELGQADVLQDGPTDESAWVTAQVKEEGLDDRALGIVRVLKIVSETFKKSPKTLMGGGIQEIRLFTTLDYSLNQRPHF